MNRKRSRHERTIDALAGLLDAAMRVSHLHGEDEDGEPSDWKEWVALRDTCLEAKYALKREGAAGRSYRATRDLPRVEPEVIRKEKA